MAVVSLLVSKAAAQEPVPTISGQRGWFLNADGQSNLLALSDATNTDSGRSHDTYGFNRGAQELAVGAGVGLGMKVFGSTYAHDWTIGTLDYGWMLSGLVAEDHWYRGNWEILGELFGGQQFHPDAAYYIGVAPLLRYDFAASHHVVPFAEAGAGISATDIRNGDLSTTYEFNLQAGVGLHFFLTDHLALTAQSRLIHLSNASTHSPNHGINNVNALLGVSWFF